VGQVRHSAALAEAQCTVVPLRVVVAPTQDSGRVALGGVVSSSVARGLHAVDGDIFSSERAGAFAVPSSSCCRMLDCDSASENVRGRQPKHFTVGRHRSTAGTVYWSLIARRGYRQ